MPVDNTNLFKACVKTIKIRDYALKDHNNLTNSATHNILKTHRKSEFILKSTQLVKQISNLRDFILQYRKAYLNFTPSFVNTDQMTDEERDNIDSNSQRIVIACSDLIKELKAECKNAKCNRQVSESNEVILDLIEGYLKAICKMIAELTSMRNKWKCDLQKIAGSEPSEMQRVDRSAGDASKESTSDIAAPVESNKKKVFTKLASSPYANSENAYDESPLTEEEMQAFQLENDLLYNDLNALNDEVRLCLLLSTRTLGDYFGRNYSLSKRCFGNRHVPHLF